ncbi:unnamed protein product [Vitrella brassicaformis CCMP3155]|uniref:Methyltransferase domain-containing protein n=2 Tax=Vitrella brassicaformis TaxID=1169539 RepID=A0A0G4ETU7_VITBC|nr:unnamed protein product [Vitrella brassicaformis CCMP3155]|mmetsp:Transcript_28955/g.72165  ORF Transcript_28955/g.72165 Transcript_28955/m.72165 type:complete len:277 (+) Transcript_28955:27-857(+)|eukprot:CEM01804.1 unnamed protein product [Vitrella brassicaformis CCMP3155]
MQSCADPVEAYDDPLFSRCYDRMVAALPKSLEVGKDVQLAATLLPEGGARILDVAAGSGRVAFGLASHFPNRPLEINLLDASQEMLSRAREQEPPHTACRFSYMHGDMSDLGKILADAPRFDLIILTAGSIHHLLEEGERKGLFEGLAQLVEPQRGRLLLTRLADEEIICAEETADATVQLAPGVTKRILRQEKQECSNGDAVVHTEFEVSEQGEEEQGSRVSWTLRTIRPEDLAAAATAHGLLLVRRASGFESAMSGNTLDVPDRDSTVFVFSIA